MKLDETTLIEIKDYINELDERVGLKPETMEDVRKAIDKHLTELKNLRLVAVSRRSEQLACDNHHADLDHFMKYSESICKNCKQKV